MKPLFASLIAVFVLAACVQGDTAGTASSTTSSSAAMQIAYVNTDSVLEGYTYLNEQSIILQKRQADASAEFERKAAKFQDQVASFQRRAQSGNMTPKSIEGEQRVLAEREQELAMEQQRLTNELQAEGIRLQNDLTTKLSEVVETIRSAKGYDYVIAYGTGSPNVLAVNPELEITTEVIAAMNAAEGAPAATATDSTASE